MKFLYLNYLDLFNDELEPLWGVFYSEFRANKLAVQFYSIFFIRRIVLAISFNFLREYPLLQVMVCSISCFMVSVTQIFIYITYLRPFKTRAMNMLNIVSEMNVTIGFTMNILFIVDTGTDDKIVAWCILASIVMTYLIHNILIFFNIIGIIIQKFRERCTRTRVRRGIQPSANLFIDRNLNYD
jgi:hypothetical protein